VMAMAEFLATLHTGQGPKQKRVQREVKDYVLRFGDDIPAPTRKQTWQQQWAILTAYAKAYSQKKPAERRRMVGRRPERAPVKKVAQGRR